jgi:hypothetical protein
MDAFVAEASSQLRYRKLVHSGPKHKFCIFYILKVSEMIRNTPKHNFGSNGVEWCFTTLVPRHSAFRPETSFHLFTCKRLAKCSIILPNIICVQWSSMDASQLWYPEIVHSGPKHKFSSFYMSMDSEVLRNTPKYYFGSDGVEWMLPNFGAPK